MATIGNHTEYVPNWVEHMNFSTAAVLFRNKSRLKHTKYSYTSDMYILSMCNIFLKHNQFQCHEDTPTYLKHKLVQT